MEKVYISRQTTRKGKKTKHARKNMEINGNTTNKHKLETA
jgi:hypothetical protein